MTDLRFIFPTFSGEIKALEERTDCKVVSYSETTLKFVVDGTLCVSVDMSADCADVSFVTPGNANVCLGESLARG
jgi:hypothetical protein